MHPSDYSSYDSRRERESDAMSDDERKRTESYSPDSWKEYAPSVPGSRTLLPLPLLAPQALQYERRRAELFPSEHKLSPQPPAPFYPSHRRHEFTPNPLFPAPHHHHQDRRQQHFQHHTDTQYRNYTAPHQRVSAADVHQQASTPPRAGKSSLAFILDNNSDHEGDDDSMDGEHSLTQLHLNDTSSRDDNDGDSSDSSQERYTTRSLSSSERRSPPAASSGRKGSIKKSRICKVDGCTRYVVNKGLCIGHGGGKRCAVAGCTSSAKNMGVCWKHGGSTKCTVDNCENRAKSRGVCWSHGGGRKCKEDGCSKTAVSNGLCWAHGGGKRCIVEGCKKPAYERNGNLCTLHKGGTHATSA